jgi:hypothetical protein
MAILNLQANGNISPCRFVCIDPSSDHKAIQCDASAVPVGVAQEGTNYAPITDADHITVSSYAAVDGEPVRIFPQGENCLLEIGDTVTRGELLKPDADGKGVPIVTNGDTTTPQFYGAHAEQSGSAGEKIRVHVVPGVYTYST